MIATNTTTPVRRPAIVTTLAYLFLTCAMTLLRAYDAKVSIGRTPLYPGSVFPIAVQWRWHGIQIPLTVLVAIGVLRGWRWARWLALTMLVAGNVIAAPLWDLRSAPLYLFALAFSLAICALLFWAPGAKCYFSRTTRPNREFSVRGGLSTILLVFAIFTAHSICFAVFKTSDATAMWGSSAVFLLPALVFSALVRWDLQRSASEIAAALLAVTIGLASWLVTASIGPWPPVATGQPGWIQSMLLTTIFGITGLALAAWAARARKMAAQ